MRMRVFAAAVLLAVSFAAHAAKAHVFWTNPTRNTDGTALTNLASITIQWGSCATGGAFGTIQAQESILEPAVEAFAFPVGLSPVCLRANAVTSIGAASAWSNVIEWTPPATLGKPGAIVGIIHLTFRRKSS